MKVINTYIVWYCNDFRKMHELENPYRDFKYFIEYAGLMGISYPSASNLLNQQNPQTNG